MNRSIISGAIIVLTIITAAIHIVLAFPTNVLFYLNGLGYLALLAALFLNIPFLAGRRALVHYVMIVYTLVTILAYFAIAAGDGVSLIEFITKVDEALLVVMLILHLRTPEGAKA